MPKILVIRFSSIGDIVLTTPVVRALKLQLGAEVHFLTKTSFAGVIGPNPYVDKLYSIDKRVGEVITDLRKESYDAVVDLHRNLRSLRVKLALSGVPAYSFNKLNWEKWLMVRFKLDRLPRIHIVERYLDAARPLGVQSDGQGLDYFIDPDDEVDITKLLMSRGEEVSVLDNTAEQPPDYTAVVIGAAHATKRLPIDKLSDFCAQLQGPLVLLGGPDDAGAGAEVAAKLGDKIINCCGRLRLNQSASVVRQAARVLSHDTGLMHIAAAFRRPIVSVWGNTIPEFGMYPYYPQGMERNHTLEVQGLDCRPCSKIGYAACPQGHFRCMLDQEPQNLPADWQQEQ